MTPAPQSTPAAVKLAGLRAAIGELEVALRGNNELEILARLNLAMSALYGMWLLLKIKGHEQMAWAGEDADRRTIVGLVFVRGEAEHQGNHVAMSIGFGEGPFGYGPFGGGWVWRDCPTDRDAFRESKALYDELVLMRGISVPLRRALTWFEANKVSNPPPIVRNPLGNIAGPFHDGNHFGLGPTEGFFRAQSDSLTPDR